MRSASSTSDRVSHRSARQREHSASTASQALSAVLANLSPGQPILVTLAHRAGDGRLQISESGTLFGFHEHGYRAAIVASIITEGAAIVALAGYLAGAGPRPQPVHASAATPQLSHADR